MTTLLLAALLAAAPALPAAALPATDGRAHALSDEVRAHGWTVVVFFSADCPVQRAHDARLRELAADFGPRGVGFLAVDAQADASLEKAARAVAARGYTFPLVVDVEGAWADALGVRFSTTVVVLDAEGRVRYRGGLDDERVKVTEKATPLARLALEALLAGQEPARVDTKALGCVLRRR